MQKIFFTALLIQFGFNLFAQENGILRPEYPKNHIDTLLIIDEVNQCNQKDQHSLSLKNRLFGTLAVFELVDPVWECQKVSFVHYLPSERYRKMDQRYLKKDELLKYKQISLQGVKNITNDGGCNKLIEILGSPTLYVVLKNELGFSAFEVLPIVHYEKID